MDLLGKRSSSNRSIWGFIVIGVIWVAVILGFWATVIYVAHHFIAKYW